MDVFYAWCNPASVSKVRTVFVYLNFLENKYYTLGSAYVTDTRACVRVAHIGYICINSTQVTHTEQN